MENILQSLVKIIIIGAAASVDCNRQFLPPPPPLPYYQNEDYFIPALAPAPPFPPTLRNHLPTYYPHRNLPDPTSFQSIKSFAPPQLFHRNENYVPPPPPAPAPAPSLPYTPPQLLPHKQPHKVSLLFSRVQYKNSPQPQPARPQQHSQKKTEPFASNIIVKEEPLYSDDYGKNYNDEDYVESYSDDLPAPGKPCSALDPYRYFEAPKGAPDGGKTPLCNPYFQPNFGGSVYTLKVPITLLPSRFPPRVEQLIERIQNYFSTYTHQQTSKPENGTAATSTVPPTAEAPSESTAQSSTGGQEGTTGTAGAAEEIAEGTTRATAEGKESEGTSTAAPEVEVKETQTGRAVEAVTEQVREADAEAGGVQVMPAGSESPQEERSTQSGSSPSGDEKLEALQPEERKSS